MMNQEIKRRIDNARNVLVGKVPDPKSQVEQITTALIYKFMDDMDMQSVSMGGIPNFFVGDYAKYSWQRLMNPSLGGQARLSLYSEAIESFSQNPNISQLFRDIFKDSYLPYRDSETLNLFLKEIDNFSYGATDNIGDAYEYLLSVLGSQGKAGQFLTPRHIIKFIVSVVDPSKNETLLDPACGTAGFLISAYLHILQANTDEKPGDLLPPNEKKGLSDNFVGYDIDPGMVRISLVNMYLHGFQLPHIYEYDTLTDDRKWQEQFDVIMANPPFMSPKGGIRPHKLFSIHGNRSEVLFVDYIAEHLNLNGRAGVIVPEGIIFQSANAYKNLRKMILDGYLWAVVSLPAGVFQPYSGVKTSILFMDRRLAKQTNKILFAKIENDGFDLGAQRREIDKNDIPIATEAMSFFKKNIRENKNQVLPEEYKKLAHIVSKQKIIDSGDYNLTGDRYVENHVFTNQKWPMVKLGEVCEISAGNTAPQDPSLFVNGKYPFYRTYDVGVVHLSENLLEVRDWLNEEGIKGLKKFKKGTILFPKSGASTFLNHRVIIGHDGFVSSHLATIFAKPDKADYKFLYYILIKVDSHDLTAEQNYPSLRLSEIENIKIPLPPLEVQKQIVDEIEGYQKIIDGARQVVENWKPTIKIDPSWPMIKLGDERYFIIEAGGTPDSKNPKYWNGDINWVTLIDLPQENNITEIYNSIRKITDLGLKNSSAKLLPINSVLVSSRATIGRIAIAKKVLATNQGFKNVIIKDTLKVDEYFLALMLTRITDKMKVLASGGTFKEISRTNFMTLEIPIPPFEVQKQIVSKIQEEQKTVDVCKRLIEINEQKIKSKISEVWDEKA